MSLSKKDNTNTSNPVGMVFGKRNYQLLIASILVVLVGFLLMMGTEDIYSFTKITLAPIVVVAGFALGVVAILINPKRNA
jgi:ABC-type Mn2+/Zn2+ transport system permease subunit